MALGTRTYPQLGNTSSIGDDDITATWSASGPLMNITWGAVRSYMTALSATTTFTNVNGPVARSNLGVKLVQTLEHFAVVAGITLGTGNDTPAFAAYKVAALVAQPFGLYCEISPGEYDTDEGVIPNNGGYIATPQTVVINQRGLTSNVAPTKAHFHLNTQYDTGCILYGIIFRGGWTYGRAP